MWRFIGLGRAAQYVVYIRKLETKEKPFPAFIAKKFLRFFVEKRKKEVFGKGGRKKGTL